jgi:hypothetical protein
MENTPKTLDMPKGLRQGYLLSPMLFILAIYPLQRIINQGAELGYYNQYFQVRKNFDTLFMHMMRLCLHTLGTIKAKITHVYPLI